MFSYVTSFFYNTNQPEKTNDNNQEKKVLNLIITSDMLKSVKLKKSSFKPGPARNMPSPLLKHIKNIPKNI